MKKNIILFSLFLTTVSFAGSYTIMKKLDPRQSKTSSFEVAKGKYTINVIPSEGTISCRLSNANDEVVDRNNLNRCDFYLEQKAPEIYNLRVTNNYSHPIEYRASLNPVK